MRGMCGTDTKAGGLKNPRLPLVRGGYPLEPKYMIVGCMCACAKQKYDQEEKARKKQEEADRIMRLRSAGI